MQSGPQVFEFSNPYTPRTVWQTPTGYPQFSEASRTTAIKRFTQRVRYQIRRSRQASPGNLSVLLSPAAAVPGTFDHDENQRKK